MTDDEAGMRPSPLERRDPKFTKWAKEEGRRIARGEEPTEYGDDDNEDSAVTPTPETDA